MAYFWCCPDTTLDFLFLVRIGFLSRLSCGEMAFPGKSLLYHLLPLLEAKSSLLSSFRFPPCLSESTPTFSYADIQVLTARQTGHTKGQHRNTSCDAALVLPYNYADKFDTMHYDRIPNMAPRAFGKFYAEAGPYINGAYVEADDYMFNYLNT